MQESEFYHRTQGYDFKTNCPWCMMCNSGITNGVRFSLDGIFEKPCTYCGKMIVFCVERVVKVTAVRKGDEGVYNHLFNRGVNRI